MNTSLNRNRNLALNSLIYPSTTTPSVNTGGSSVKSWLSPFWITIFVVLLIAVVIGILGSVYHTTVASWFSSPAAPVAPVVPSDETAADASTTQESSKIVEKVLPSSGHSQVFSVNSNKYTYYDAEPLCKALGAELATYDQVKEAWAKGADWCNYGWVKGQQALFPTQEETYKKMELGPEEQRLSCGKPGVNGGFFDNPELRFGVSCYGTKPAQSEHDAIEQSAGIPMSPDALEYDKKVAQFKSETGSIGILPFNTKTWSA
jgi:Extracellular link domain